MSLDAAKRRMSGTPKVSRAWQVRLTWFSFFRIVIHENAGFGPFRALFRRFSPVYRVMHLHDDYAKNA